MLRRWNDYRIIKKSGLFDPAYYLLNNPDVRQADIDPMSHFIEIGWKEGRNPSARFDTRYYLEMNPDVYQAGVNPLLHYLRYGQKEGRSINPAERKSITSDPRDPTKLISVSPVVNRTGFPIPDHQAPVDIIVCVHNALDDVVRCLNSIVAHTSQPYHLILVNDGSQAETSEYLEEFSKSHSATLIVNTEARGYTRAANQGLRQSKAEYVLLINSDTIVSNEWLDRMCACIETDPTIGIVGPLSNTASWQSVPEIFEGEDWAANPIPEGFSVDEMAALVARNSARLSPEMKLLNGFCLLIRRKLFDEVGLFDEDTFGEGYGEEDDYTLRARAKGWKLALADDVYIYHAQSKSYSHERRKQLTARAGKALADKHGQEIINTSCAFNLDSPVLEGVRARSKVMVERENLLQQGRKEFAGKRVLFALPVALAGGGANVVFSEAAEMIKMGVDVRVFNLEDYRTSFQESYPDLTIPVTFGTEADFAALARSFDAVIATVYYSVEWLKGLENSQGRPILGYYVQGFEPLIFPPNTPGFDRALASYTLLPDMISFTKTLWTQEQVLRNTGVECTSIGVSLDIDLFRPRPREEQVDQPVVISAMIRPESLYREPRLTMQVLREISLRYGSRVEIRIFGTPLGHPDFGNLPLDFPWKLAGRLNPSQMASFFNTTDIFVDFSSHQAMGLTALEAMACGNAVVIPENGGTVDYGRHGENCLIVNTLSFDACLEAVKKLIDNRDLLTKIQKNAIQDVCAFYPERSAYNILELLFGDRNLLKVPANPRARTDRIEMMEKTNLRIDLGCGSAKKAGTLGLDYAPGPDVDYVLDLTKEPLPFADRTVAYTHSSHFLEHLKNPIPVFQEVNRVSMEGAQLEFWTPYAWSNSAFVLGHETFLAEDIYLHFQWYCDFWRPHLGAYWIFSEFRYVMYPETLGYLYKKGISVDFAVRHLKNVVYEFCVYATVSHAVEKPVFPTLRRTFATGRFEPAYEIKEDFENREIDADTLGKAIRANTRS
jgi:GT2 family glycosyltransferase/SAM-dependent methyltransferase